VSISRIREYNIVYFQLFTTGKNLALAGAAETANAVKLWFRARPSAFGPEQERFKWASLVLS
jgi:hypothetical protein